MSRPNVCALNQHRCTYVYDHTSYTGGLTHCPCDCHLRRPAQIAVPLTPAQRRLRRRLLAALRHARNQQAWTQGRAA